MIEHLTQAQLDNIISREQLTNEIVIECSEQVDHIFINNNYAEVKFVHFLDVDGVLVSVRSTSKVVWNGDQKSIRRRISNFRKFANEVEEDFFILLTNLELPHENTKYLLN